MIDQNPVPTETATRVAPIISALCGETCGELQYRVAVEIDRAIAEATLGVREDCLNRERILLQHAALVEDKNLELRRSLSETEAQTQSMLEEHTEVLAEMNATLTRLEKQLKHAQDECEAANARLRTAEFESATAVERWDRAKSEITQMELALRAKNRVLAIAVERASPGVDDRLLKEIKTALHANPETIALAEHLKPAIRALSWAKSDPVATDRTRREAADALAYYECL